MKADETRCEFRGYDAVSHEDADELYPCHPFLSVFIRVPKVYWTHHSHPKLRAMIGASSGNSAVRFAIALTFGAFFANQRMPGRQRVIAAR
jgi:hypothetical protein